MELRSQRRRRLAHNSHDKNWGGLPQELLDLIAQNLTTAQDFCRFGAVCASWREAAVQANYNPNADRQVPWLMIPPAVNRRRGCRVHNFYDPSTGRTHKRRLPVAINPRTRVVGSGHGWVATLKPQERKVRLLNPLGRDPNMITTLPPLSCSGSVTVSVSGSPGQGSFMALLHDKPLMKQAMARVGTGAAPSSCRQWTIIDVDDGDGDDIDHEIRQFAPFKGHFYGIDIMRDALVVVEEEDKKLDGSVPALRLRDVLVELPHDFGSSGRTYLVPGAEDLLLCVSSRPLPHIIARSKWCPPWQWQVYRVEMEEEEAKLVSMDSLGDGAVFISDKSSIYVSKLPSSCSGGDGRSKCKSNSIYFHSSNIPAGVQVCVWEYNLEDGSRNPFYTGKTSDGSTNIPSVWVVPNLW